MFYSAFNLCYRPLCNALAGDLINIVIWITNGEDTGKLGGGCRGEMLHKAPGCVWRQEDCVLPGIDPLQGPTALAGAWDSGVAQPFPSSASFTMGRGLRQSGIHAEPSVLLGSNHEPVTHQDWCVSCVPAPWGPGSHPVQAATPFHAALLYDGFLQDISQKQKITEVYIPLFLPFHLLLPVYLSIRPWIILTASLAISHLPEPHKPLANAVLKQCGCF